MSEDILQEFYFCDLEIVDLSQGIIGFFIILISMGAISKAIIQYNKTGGIRQNTKLIYFLIFVYIIIILGMVIFAQIVFWYQYASQPSSSFTEFNAVISKYMWIGQFLEFIIFSLLLFLVAYNQMRNVIEFIEYMVSQRFRRRYLLRQKIAIKIIISCLIFLFLTFILVIPFAIFQQARKLNILAKIANYAEIFVMLLLGGIYFLNIYLVKTNQKLNILLSARDSKNMIKKYSLLTILIIVRSVWQIIQKSIALYNNKLIQQQCQINRQNQSTIKIISILISSLIQYPILWVILRLYSYQEIIATTSNYSRAQSTLDDETLSYQ